MHGRLCLGLYRECFVVMYDVVWECYVEVYIMNRICVDLLVGWLVGANEERASDVWMVEVGYMEMDGEGCGGAV